MYNVEPIKFREREIMVCWLCSFLIDPTFETPNYVGITVESLLRFVVYWRRTVR
jgi:hypothetical protein